MSNIKCPICGTIQPEEVEFCVYCNTPFDKATITRVTDDKNESGSSNTNHEKNGEHS